MYIFVTYPFPKIEVDVCFIGPWRHLLEFNSNNNSLLLKFMRPWRYLVAFNGTNNVVIKF